MTDPMIGFTNDSEIDDIALRVEEMNDAAIARIDYDDFRNMARALEAEEAFVRPSLLRGDQNFINTENDEDIDAMLKEYELDDVYEDAA